MGFYPWFYCSSSSGFYMPFVSHPFYEPLETCQSANFVLRDKILASTNLLKLILQTNFSSLSLARTTWWNEGRKYFLGMDESTRAFKVIKDCYNPIVICLFYEKIETLLIINCITLFPFNICFIWDICFSWDFCFCDIWKIELIIEFKFFNEQKNQSCQRFVKLENKKKNWIEVWK